MEERPLIYIMGVSGSGKSTVGTALAEALGLPFYDGDDFHPQSNLAKMASGTPLNDEDRWGWLEKIHTQAQNEVLKKGAVIACSALKQSYRAVLSKDISNVFWVYLEGSFTQIKTRMEKRKGHFMPPALLQSQFDSLEVPQNAYTLSIDHSVAEMVAQLTPLFLKKTDFGLLGLGVMGKGLARNLAHNGQTLSLYNRHVPGVEENIAKDFKAAHPEFKEALAFDSLAPFVNSIAVPRKILLMVPAGNTVDEVIEALIPLLSPGDIVIDGGNSHYKATLARSKRLENQKLHYFGMGVSGGEEGALNGPSLMVGGDKNSYPLIQNTLEAIAAKDKDGKGCCSYIGTDGSGHFVKMVHNGIEYAEMQLLAELTSLLKAQGKNYNEMAHLLESWQKRDNSYLLEITTEILKTKEENTPLVDKILDKAGNKGTGNWTAIASAQLGLPSTMITAALYARYTSFFKGVRVSAEQQFTAIQKKSVDIRPEALFNAFRFARLINHYQGFRIIHTASKANHWEIDFSNLARTWTKGCIIQSDLMQELVSALTETEDLLTHPDLIKEVNQLYPDAQNTVALGITASLDLPCFTAAVQYLIAHSTANSSANIIQAQRDYFGAHTYQRTDDPTGQFYHTQWKK